MATENTQGQGSKGAITPERRQEIINLLKRDRALVLERSLKPIEEGQVLLEFNGEPVVQKNSLTVIKGKTGVHKSRVAQAICSLLITDDNSKRAALGFRVRGTEPTSVIYVDTERNHSADFPQAIQTMREHAGYGKYDKQVILDFFSFLGLQRPDRLPAIRLVSNAARLESRDKGHIVVVLDVVTDCISDFNDLKETYLLTDEFAQCMKDEDVSFIAIIHENPDTIRSTKARGHLGTEIANKASAVFQIAKCNDGSETFVINVEKSRSSRLPKPVHITYDDIFQRMVVCEPPKAKVDKTVLQLLEYLSKMEGVEISKEELEKGTDIKRTTLDRKLKEILDNGHTISRDKEIFHLKVVKTGKKSVVKLQLDGEEPDLEDDI